MTVIIYGDFNCPYSYLASQRADRLGGMGIDVDWRAVEHDRHLPVTGARSASDPVAWARSLAEVTSLAFPGEDAPATPPALITNTQAAVAAYAEAVSDGVASELRRRLFAAIWARGLHLSSVYEVRHLVVAVMWPQEEIASRLASPEIPSLLIRDPDLARIMRRSGGTIALDGGPLTASGSRRVRHWRHEWLGLPGQTIPAVVGLDGAVRAGPTGLGYLADLGRGTLMPAGTDALPHQDRPDHDASSGHPATAAA
jgi:2-hydroxychromene-2-carboxylate isomerase